MSDDCSVGYKRPPKAHRFKPGVSGNPKGRKKRDPSDLAQIIANVMAEPVAYQEQGRRKLATQQELKIKTLIDYAVSGNLGAMEYVLKLRDQAKRLGDAGVQRILIRDWLPDRPGQTAEEKTTEFTRTGVAEPLPWWQDLHKKSRAEP